MNNIESGRKETHVTLRGEQRCPLCSEMILPGSPAVYVERWVGTRMHTCWRHPQCVEVAQAAVEKT